MNSHLKIFTCCAILAAMTGCASITGDRSQQIRLETYDQSGTQITGASCKLSNDYGQVATSAPGTATVHRSAVDLSIECSKPGFAYANARAISRANTGMYGNIIIGGGIGAIIDHNNGSAYTYPKWMNLVFGQTLSFDRRTEVDGQPAVALQINAERPVQALSATTSQTEAVPVPVAPVNQASFDKPAPVPVTTLAPAPTVSQATEAGPYKIQTIEFVTGVSSTSVERIAKEYGCAGGKGAGLITSNGPVEVYRMLCESGKTFLAKCELRQCKAM